jgi:hypothetical protein
MLPSTSSSAGDREMSSSQTSLDEGVTMGAEPEEGEEESGDDLGQSGSSTTGVYSDSSLRSESLIQFHSSFLSSSTAAVPTDIGNKHCSSSPPSDRMSCDYHGNSSSSTTSAGTHRSFIVTPTNDTTHHRDVISSPFDSSTLPAGRSVDSLTSLLDFTADHWTNSNDCNGSSSGDNGGVIPSALARPTSGTTRNGYVSPFLALRRRGLTLDGLSKSLRSIDGQPEVTDVTDRREMFKEKQIVDRIDDSSPTASHVNNTGRQLTVFHSLHADGGAGNSSQQTEVVLSGLDETCAVEQIIERVLKQENLADVDWRLFELRPRTAAATAAAESHWDPNDAVTTSETELHSCDRPLFGRLTSDTVHFDLLRKKDIRIKVVCESVSGRPKHVALDVAPNATARQVIRTVVQRFELSDEEPEEYSLIQIDKTTKDVDRISDDVIISDLHKDYFLLCKNENLARQKTPAIDRSLSDDARSRSSVNGSNLDLNNASSSSPASALISGVLSLLSPSSPGPLTGCGGGYGGRLRVPSVSSLTDRSQSPSMFPWNVSATADSAAELSSLQSRVHSLERELAAKERTWNERLTVLQKSVERFKACAFSPDPVLKANLLEHEFRDVTRAMQLQEQRVRQAQGHLDRYRESRNPIPEKISELQSHLLEAEKQLSAVTQEQINLFPVLEAARKDQVQKSMTTSEQVQPPTDVATCSALYDVIARCPSRCYTFASVLRPGECGRLEVGRDDDGWPSVLCVVPDSCGCLLQPGDRFLEVDSRPGNSMDDAEFSSLLSLPKKPLRVVVLRQTSEEPSLLQDICQWMETMN